MNNEPKLIKEVKVYIVECPKCNCLCEAEVIITYHTYDTSSYSFMRCEECGHTDRIVLSADI